MATHDEQEYGDTVAQDSVKLSKWTISFRETSILNTRERDEIRRQINAPELPEMLFGSEVSIRHNESGSEMNINAFDALRGWRNLNVDPPRVRVAEEWQRAHRWRFKEKEIDRINDTTDEQGNTESSHFHRPNFDWTFTTKYACTTRTHRQWRNASDASDSIDWERLKKRDTIRLFRCMTLYESELDDFGLAELCVKMRVMPNCLLVLVRFLLRIDGVILRCNETRLFTDFNQAKGKVIRDRRQCECDFDDLKACGAATSSSQIRSSDDAIDAIYKAKGLPEPTVDVIDMS